MKVTHVVLAVLLACGSVLPQMSAQTPKPTTLHVTRSQAGYDGGRYVRLWGTIGTEKVELLGNFYVHIGGRDLFVLPPGDYPVILEGESREDRGISRKYKVETAPGKFTEFQLAGMSE